MTKPTIIRNYELVTFKNDFLYRENLIYFMLIILIKSKIGYCVINGMVTDLKYIYNLAISVIFYKNKCFFLIYYGIINYCKHINLNFNLIFAKNLTILNKDIV